MAVLHAATPSIPLDAPTIQDGIDAVADGDTVCVSAGTYDFGVYPGQGCDCDDRDAGIYPGHGC